MLMTLPESKTTHINLKYFNKKIITLKKLIKTQKNPIIGYSRLYYVQLLNVGNE